jgi:hypothetical protein
LRNAAANGRLSVWNSWSAISGPLGHTRYECQGPFFPLQQQFHFFNDSRYLGFTYDLFGDDAENPDFSTVYTDEAWLPTYPTTTTLTYTVPVVDTATETPPDVPANTTFFVPAECTVSSGRCCPSFEGSECGGTTRGLCVDITASDDVCDNTNHADSLFWFTNYFSYACVCNGNYDGANCGVCKPGYEGSECQTETQPRLRRDFNVLSDTERQSVVDAFRMAQHAQSIYQPGVSVLQHFAATVFWHLPGNSVPTLQDAAAPLTFAHIGKVAWYRTLLMRLESELSRITGDASFALPYWDWSFAQNNDNEAFFRWFGGDGDTNSTFTTSNPYCRIPDRDGLGGCNCLITREPFPYAPLYGHFGADIGVVQRTFMCQGTVAASLPTRDVVAYWLTLPTFFAADNTTENFAKILTGGNYTDSIRSWPEGLYGDGLARVQNWVAGTMTTPELQSHRPTPSSPGSDPMYYLMLSHADLIVERWLRRAVAQGWEVLSTVPLTEAGVGLNRNECQAPFFPLTTNAKVLASSTTLGYTYDFFANNPTDATVF